MSKNYYSEINLHIVWHTKGSSPLLTPAVEPLAHRELRLRVLASDGVFLHEIGGIETHVHLAVSIPPTLKISDWIGQLKGGTSHDVNKQAGRNHKVLEWQSGYGVVSFGTHDLEQVTAYIRNQHDHHARGDVRDWMERITHPENDE